MKKSEKKKLHEKGLKELQSLLSKLKEELTDMRIGKTAKSQKDIHGLLKKRSQIAIVKTIIKEKELQGPTL